MLYGLTRNACNHLSDSGLSEDVSKKEKKKKRKHASQEDVDEPADVDEGESLAGVSREQCVTSYCRYPENGEKKKKKKKRKHADAETEAEASAAADPDQMEVDTPQRESSCSHQPLPRSHVCQIATSTDGEKKKKKRKHDAEGATPTADPSGFSNSVTLFSPSIVVETLLPRNLDFGRSSPRMLTWFAGEM